MQQLILPARSGGRPAVSRPGDVMTPHQQLTELAPVHIQNELLRRAAALPGVTVGPSKVSVPGARAFHLDTSHARGPSAAFQRDTEFAHLHPPYDGSLHITLPPTQSEHVVSQGWGEPHPLSASLMVYGPRDAEELEVVWRILGLSYAWATGETIAPAANSS